MELQSFIEYKILENLRKANYQDSYLVYKFAKLLRTDFNRWDAYRFNVIDNQGNIIDIPATPQQKKAFGELENIARKVKRALVKYSGKGNTLTNLIALFLLKKESKVKREFLDELDNEEIEMIEHIIVELKNFKLTLEVE